MGGGFEMMLEGPLVARVIGKGGENIKRLQEETGAKIVIIQVSFNILIRCIGVYLKAYLLEARGV